MKIKELTCPHCLHKHKPGQPCKFNKCSVKTLHVHCPGWRVHRGTCGEIIKLDREDFDEI